MKEKFILVTVFSALLIALGFLSYQVYERDKTIRDLQMSVLKAEIILGMCKKANEGLKEKIKNKEIISANNLSGNY
jgi:hypothetical protein